MKINLKLSKEGIEQAKRQIQKYQSDLNRKVELLIKKLTEEGIVIARAEINGLDIIDTGNLRDSTIAYFNESTGKGVIICRCEYAVYVEFGTGVMGKMSQYDGPFMAMVDAGYNYLEGTTYVTTKDGRYGWFYPSDEVDENGKPVWKFTEGQMSRPFMYETACKLRDEFPRLVREVFGR